MHSIEASGKYFLQMLRFPCSEGYLMESDVFVRDGFSSVGFRAAATLRHAVSYDGGQATKNATDRCSSQSSTNELEPWLHGRKRRPSTIREGKKRTQQENDKPSALKIASFLVGALHTSTPSAICFSLTCTCVYNEESLQYPIDRPACSSVSDSGRAHIDGRGLRSL